MAKGWFSKLWDYGLNKQAWDENWAADNATTWQQDLGTLWDGFMKHGFNGASWRGDPAAQKALDMVLDEFGDIAKTTATVAGVGYGAGAIAKTPALASGAKWLGSNIFIPAGKAAGQAYVGGLLTPDQPDNPIADIPTSQSTEELYAKMARQMYQNQPQQLFYGGFYGGRGGGNNRSRRTGTSDFRGW